MFIDGYRELLDMYQEIISNNESNRHYSQASLVCTFLERFLRILPAVGATNSDKLSNLLDKAFSHDRKALYLPSQINVEDFKKSIRDLRNGILHGNYEQLVQRSGAHDVQDYWKNHFPEDLLLILTSLQYFLLQIDSNTGKKNPIFEFLIEGKPLPPINLTATFKNGQQCNFKLTKIL